MKKKIVCLFFAFVLLMIAAAPLTASAENSDYNYNLPYFPYTYDANGQAVLTPSPYSAVQTINGASLGIGGMSNPSDIFYFEKNGSIYITDTGNSRVIILDKHFKLTGVIDSFVNAEGNKDTFLNPSATYVRTVTKDGVDHDLLYISDTDNSRIVCLDANTLDLVKVYNRPDIPILGENYAFLPKRIAVDLAGRIYVLVKNVNQGIVLLDPDGNFVKLAGAPKVQSEFSLWELFMTDAQLENMKKSVPTEYNSIHIDKDGFIYLSTTTDGVNPIARLNTQGDDILQYPSGNNPQGDSNYSVYPAVTSAFVDVAVRDDGIYAAVDTTMGRVFVYDREGSLLYAFGGSGNQKGTFYSPGAVEMFDNVILVSDIHYNTITVFKQSQFGEYVDKAVTFMVDGDYDNANIYWNKILDICPSYDSAYIYLARVDIQNKNYSEALSMLKGTGKMDYYSKAFKGVRDQFVRNNFTVLFIGLLALIAVIVVCKVLFKKYKVIEKIDSVKVLREYRYSNYVMFHPFDGFWDLKREKRGSLKAANILLVLFIITYALRAQYTSYMFSGLLPNQINVFFELAKMLIPIFLWIVSNWCFTTLMSGEGTMKDIYIATMYALKPYIITAIPLLLLSHCLSADEAFIYTSISTIVMIWMLALILLGMKTTHDYSMLKGIIAAVLTLVGILLIIFLALVIANVVQDIYDLISSIVREISYRTY